MNKTILSVLTALCIMACSNKSEKKTTLNTLKIYDRLSNQKTHLDTSHQAVISWFEKNYPEVEVIKIELVEKIEISEDDDSLIMSFPPYKRLLFTSSSYFQNIISHKVHLNNSEIRTYVIHCMKEENRMDLQYFEHILHSQNDFLANQMNNKGTFILMSAEGKAKNTFVPIVDNSMNFGFLMLDKVNFPEVFIEPSKGP